MAEISLKKEVIETTIANINTNVSNLNEHFNSICNQVDMIKGVWVDNIGLFANITTLLNSIREVNRDYRAFAEEFTKVLKEMVINYEEIDKKVSSSVSIGDIVTMTLGAKAFSNFDFAKTANNASNLASNSFLNEKNVYKEAFTDGEYKLNYLDDNVVRIDKDGFPMVFTTKENAEALINSGNSTGTPSNSYNSNVNEATSSNAYSQLGNTKFSTSAKAANTEMLQSPDSLTKKMAAKVLEGKVDTSNLYTYDKNGRVSLNELHPKVEDMKNQLIEECARQGIPIKITESVRSVGRQDQLYAQGRTAPGSRVTNAKGSSYSSNHQWGIAFDVCMANGDPYDVDKLKQVGEIGKSIGLEWGGDWTTIVDMPHFQLSDYGSGTKEIKAMYGTPDKFANTWNEND